MSQRDLFGVTLFQEFPQFLKSRSNLIDISQFTFHSVHSFCSSILFNLLKPAISF